MTTKEQRGNLIRRIISLIIVTLICVVLVIGLVKARDLFLTVTTVVTLAVGASFYLWLRHLQQQRQFAAIDQFLKIVGRLMEVAFITLSIALVVFKIGFKISTSQTLYFWYSILGVALLREATRLYRFFRVD
ncbi:hypothetical protein [Lapidilactobacillus wuchangensis]|uniref:hypothetical protein n=1 Tax=Lapidilactobacillus wuchangensis TaxID=2486001 RepID=UPI000F7A867A|nr:hypothetical protein [Lapidilactobacillus wuchangensis]